jgi:Uma2 family endonuclease
MSKLRVRAEYLDSVSSAMLNGRMASSAPAPVARHLFTVDDYHRMGEAGIFGEDDRVELIEGEIIEMSPIGSPHAARVKRLTRLLVRRLGTRAIVQVQDPVRLSQLSEPQPDLGVLKPRADFYAARHPEPADILLVVEVADSSRVFDREVKAPLYARSGIVELWVVDVIDEVVEVYRKPARGSYRDVVRVRRAQRVTMAAFPHVSFRVRDILG